MITFNMVCHGLSQNTKNYQLNSYRDGIVGKPYSEICDNIAIKMIFEPWALYRDDKAVWKEDRMDVPYTPDRHYLNMNQISLDSEIVQTFVEHCHISHVDITAWVSINQ